MYRYCNSILSDKSKVRLYSRPVVLFHMILSQCKLLYVPNMIYVYRYYTTDYRYE